MNEYKVIVGSMSCICITPPLRNEQEARNYAMGWYVHEMGRMGRIHSVTLLKRGVVPHDLSSGTSEA